MHLPSPEYRKKRNGSRHGQSASTPFPAAYQDTARKLVDALREAISTDLSDAEEREVGVSCLAAAPCSGAYLHALARWPLLGVGPSRDARHRAMLGHGSTGPNGPHTPPGSCQPPTPAAALPAW